MNRFLPCFLLFLGLAMARPSLFKDEVASVDSIISNVRAPVSPGFATEVEDLLSAGTEARKSRQAKSDSEPKKTQMKNASGKSDQGGYYKTYGSDAEGEKGYLKETYSKGDHGYKSLDTFHKQDGDNYGFEKHTAFGKGKGGEEGGKHGKSASYTSHQDGHGDDHEGAGTIVDTHYAPVEGHYESEHYSEGDTSGVGDAGYYSEGASDLGHYVEGGEGGDKSGSYSIGDTTGEHYSLGSGSDGSHDTHGSYTAGDDSGDHEGYTDY